MDAFLSCLENHAEDFDTHERGNVYECGDPFIRGGYSKYLKPTISYNYLNYDQFPDYCFNHASFTADDFKIYFKKIKQISSTTYHSLITTSDKSLDFTIYGNGNPELVGYFKSIVGLSNIKPEQRPSFGRIGLYNSTPLDPKAPRIFFFIGHQCMLHIFLFDPFHQIYKGAN